MSALRIAVIGAGYMGRKHVGYLAAGGPCRLTAVVDPDPDSAAERIAKQHDARYCRDVGELLSGEPIDGAIVASPTDLHEEVTRRCIDAGVPAGAPTTELHCPRCASTRSVSASSATSPPASRPWSGRRSG